MIRVLLGVEILLELVCSRQVLQKNGYTCSRDYNDLQAIDNLRKIVDDEHELAVYVPQALVHKLEYLIKNFTNRNYGEAKRGIDEVLTITEERRFQILDQNNILRKANAIFSLDNYPQRADLSDAVILLCAKELSLDAIVTYEPQKFRNIIDLRNNELSDFNIKIFTPIQFVNFMASSNEEINNDNEDEIIVFSPERKEIKFRKSSDLSVVTPVDFAYSLHEDLGNQCSKAYVNGIEVPLNTHLKTGDVVTISKESKSPKKEWLDFVGTRKAKTKIENWFKHQSIKNGWKILKELGMTVAGNKCCFPEEMQILQDIAEGKKYPNLEALVGAIGADINHHKDIDRINNIIQEIEKRLKDTKSKIQRGREILERDLNISFSTFNKTLLTIAKKLNHRSINELFITLDAAPEKSNLVKKLWQEQKEVDNSCWCIARCCNPLPGNQDEIVAVGRPGSRIVRIHRSDCQSIQSIKDLYPDHVRSESWNDYDHCVASLFIETYDWPGTFQTVLKELAEKGIWVDIRNVTSHANKTSTVHLAIPITSREELARIKSQVTSSVHGIKQVEWKRIIAATATSWWHCNLLDKPEVHNQPQAKSTS
jgi:predicted nucleic acid-binding protein